MSVWTHAELDEQIAETKAALKEAVKLQSYETASGGSATKATRNQVQALENHLKYLESEKARIAGTQGFQVLAGRPAR